MEVEAGHLTLSDGSSWCAAALVDKKELVTAVIEASVGPHQYKCIVDSTLPPAVVSSNRARVLREAADDAVTVDDTPEDNYEEGSDEEEVRARGTLLVHSMWEG